MLRPPSNCDCGCIRRSLACAQRRRQPNADPSDRPATGKLADPAAAGVADGVEVTIRMMGHQVHTAKEQVLGLPGLHLDCRGPCLCPDCSIESRFDGQQPAFQVQARRVNGCCRFGPMMEQMNDYLG